MASCFQCVIFCVFITCVATIKIFRNQPKLYVSNGHLNVIMPAEKDIHFETSSMHINGMDLLSTLKGTENASRVLQNYERFIAQYYSKMDYIENRLLYIRSDNLLSNTTNTTLMDPNMYMKFRRIDRRLAALQRLIANLNTLLTKDDCASNPCKNGGVCLDMYNGFLCQCQSGWEGPTCENDINECTRFKGTDLDCQNGGTCRNLPGTYQCFCQNGWVGIHCSQKSTDCRSGGSEICGHGTCIPQNNEAGYKCLCDPGWSNTGFLQACSIDVDECKLNHPPCSIDPLVLCANIPGSFVCQHCPSGYTGNGYYCADINECQLFNGGCSVSPFVECINMPGSSKCGPCPPGYQGDGKMCSYRGVCNIDNGGCSLLARCVENPAISIVQCVCPPGYAGSGMGPNGCFITNYNATSCSTNPCVHGICMTNTSPQGFSCVCDRRHSGTYCEREKDPCATNPCLNGGTCQKRLDKFVCFCLSGFSGKFCHKEQQGCGGNINQSNGTLSYPPTDYTISNGSYGISCTWTITTEQSMVIQINFTKFYIESSKTCSSGWFQINDGKSSASPSLGRYCGNTVPFNGALTTTHNVVYIWLRSYGQILKPEFELTWTTKKPDCGGDITGENGTIISPGWPSNYPNNRNCYWFFKVPTNKRLLFHIYSLNIGSDSDCSGDILEFYTTNNIFGALYRNQQEASNQRFATFCNSTIPEPFYSTFYQGYVHFKSNERDNYLGFQIGYTTDNGIPGCGGTYTNDNGYIQSIEMTSSMPISLTCIHEIKLPINTTIRLEIVEMNLDVFCHYSGVAIYQGSSADFGLIGKFCGSSLPGPMETFGNNVLIVSKSTMLKKNHWKIKYESVCTVGFTAAVGSIVPYQGTEYCTYLIEQPVGNIIILNVELTGHYQTTQDCLPYYVEVRDGDNENSSIIGRYCNSDKKITIESTTNYLWIRSRTSLNLIGSFTANYTSLYTGCGLILKKEVGTVSFPSQGNAKYASNKKCRWVFMAPNDKVIQLTWMTFNLEQSIDCTYDYIEVFDNNTGDGMGSSMGKYCGFSLPPAMTSSSNVMTIDFMSDNTIQGDGFLVSYTFIKENNVCGANYFSPAGVIRSPGYPHNYPTNKECIWTITVSPGNQIMLNVTDFNIEAYSGCRYDSLEIRNGGTPSSPLIGKYCGTTIPKLIPSHANKLLLKLNSDMTRTAKGFKIQWSSAATGCGGSLTSPSGAIMSPHYPEPYTKNSDCFWKIVVSAGTKIQIIFADIDLEKHSLCGLDYIQIFDGITINSKSLGKFCSPQTSPVISSANSLLVRFKSNSSFQGRGFNIQYSVVCTNNLTGFGGVIESPNFPNEYPQDQNCVWDIIVSEKNKINITFSHFAVERSTTFENKSCQFDYVEIEYQMDDNLTDYSEEPKYEKYGRYCGYANPGLITLNSHRAKVHFVSDSLLLGAGFRLEWQLFGCGGILTYENGHITSPNYPRPYPPSIECTWLITAPLRKSINITFHEIDIEKDSGCNYDFVKLYNGKDASYQLIATFCHQLKPVTVTSTGNNMFIQFKADPSYQGTGFTATYKTEPTNCGGLLTVSSGYIFSPNYPQNYNKNETCEWLINIDEHHLIELEFEDVDLVKGDCNKTYIKVYDGPNQAYPLLETICGNALLNKTIKSTFENLFIEFRSETLLTSKGFKAKFKKACGATIKTSSSGTLQISKEHISLVTDIGNNCSYTIQSEDLSKHVTLTITLLSHSGWCDEEYYGTNVRVYNGPFSDSPLLGSYCGPKIPLPIVSDGSALHIEFSQATDFFATYTVLDDQCGGDLLSQEGVFATPGWPKTYPNNIKCLWDLSMGPGNTINLNFLNFDIPDSDHCDTDFLEIRETNATGKLLGVYCGTTIPNNLTAVGKLYILFKSSTLEEGVATTNKGFKVEYAISTENTLSGPEGSISSPGYPGSVFTYASFSWLVTTKPGTRIEITFKDYFMETAYLEDDCLANALRIYDGMDVEAKSLMEKCNNDFPAPLLSSTNMIFVVFDYLSDRLKSKFLIKWKELTVKQIPLSYSPTQKTTFSNTTSSACQFVYSLEIDPKMIIISSPGYPNGYASNLNCEWIFTTSSQNHLLVQVLELNFGSLNYVSCDNIDVIRIFHKPDKNSQWDKIKEICNAIIVVEEVLASNLVKVEFTSGRHHHGIGFKVRVLAVCGGTLTESSGYITYDINILNRRECQWNITVKSGRTIMLTFESFHLIPGEANKCQNYIIIKNGKFPDSPLLGDGKFCGPDTPPKMESSSNHLYLKYNGKVGINNNQQTNFQLFKIYYEEVSSNCGEHYQLSLEETEMEIWSPNYPNIPPAHFECIWTFRAPTGEALRIDFEERFDISDKPKCDKDYLELRDGGTELAPLIGTFCSEIPSTKFTTDNMLRIKFFTDSDEPRNGFKAKISISYCGGTLRGLEGHLSNKVPHYIRMGSNCTWFVKAPLGFYINITFPIFRVALQVSNCNRTDVSKVILYEHSSIFGNDTNLGIFCGSNNIQSIRSSSNEVIVSYISKSDQDEFLLEYKTQKQTCEKTLIQESGIITSPGYPDRVHEPSYCLWRIRVPKGRRITLNMKDVDFGETYFVVYEGFDVGPKLVPKPNSTLKTGDIFETSDNDVNVLYWKDLPNYKRGFKMKFTSDNPTLCVGDFNQTYGEFSSPLTTEPYKCEWEHYQRAENETVGIKVAMKSKVTYLGTSCHRQITGIHIFSHITKYFGKLCSTGKQFFRSPQPTIILLALSYEISGLNFTISYKTYKCGGILKNEEGTISSPNFPNSPSTSMECSWHLNMDREHKIKINLTTLNLGNDCDKSYLIIYNGNSPMDPRIGKYCKNNKPDLITTQSNTAVIEYKYEEGGDGSSKGFKLSYEPEIHGCGGIYHRRMGILATPNYNNKDYPNNVECLWEIHVDDGNRVKLTFNDRFHIEESENCANDYVEIFDWQDEKWISLGKKCGRTLPEQIISSNTKLKILFRSNEKIAANGFKVNWILQCGGELDVSTRERYLMSPGYPNSVRANCTYKFVPKKRGGVLNIKFLDFNLNEMLDCSHNNLTIIRIFGESSQHAQEVFCGKNKPVLVRLKGSVIITYNFEYAHWGTNTGFKMSYRDESCGGNITSPTSIEVLGTNISQNLMIYLQPRVSCTWYISAPSNQIAVLSVDNFNMESCSLNIYDGLVATEPKKLLTLCGKIDTDSKPVSSNSNSMLIKLDAMSRVFGGFKGMVYFTYGPSAGCGGIINLTDTINLKSPDALPNIDCHWTIIAPKDQKIQLEFTRRKFSEACGKDVRNHTFICTCSFIEVRDGGGPFADLISKMCSNETNSQKKFTTSSSTAYLRLYSAVAQNDMFSVTLKSIKTKCGLTELTVTSDFKELTSPDYPNTYPYDIKCTWVLINPNLDGKIILHFEDFELLDESSDQVTSTCDDDRLDITEDPNIHIITMGYGPSAKYHHKNSPLFINHLSYNQYSFCGKDTKPFDFLTVGNSITLSFKSYTSGNKGKGFKLKYRSSAKCGLTELTVTSDFKELTSPDYPNTYPYDIKCTWVLINPNLDGKIILHFEDFELLDESSDQVTSTCDDDRLDITKDPNIHIITMGYGPSAKYHHKNSPLFINHLPYNQYSFCGKDTKPFDFRLRAQWSVKFQLFVLDKERFTDVGCNRTIYANEGLVRNNPHDKNSCIITIIADKNTTLSLYFLEFKYSINDCSNHGIEIRENNSTGTQLLQACGYRLPNPVFSKSNQLYIHGSNGDFFNSQYKFLFVSSEQGQGCGGKIFNFEGKFSSPMFPNVNRKDLECTWDVKVPKGYKVAFKFSEFDIMGSCLKNKVVVTTYGNGYPTEHKFCQQDVPAVLYSDVILQVKYFSSVYNEGKGWLATFKAVKEESDQLFWF